jgi:hypothetical protein
LRWLNNLKEMVPENFGKDKLDKIIKEGMGHIKILSNELVALKNEYESCFIIQMCITIQYETVFSLLTFF